MQRDLHAVEDVSCAFEHVCPVLWGALPSPDSSLATNCYVLRTASGCRCAGLTVLGPFQLLCLHSLRAAALFLPGPFVAPGQAEGLPTCLWVASAHVQEPRAAPVPCVLCPACSTAVSRTGRPREVLAREIRLCGSDYVDFLCKTEIEPSSKIQLSLLLDWNEGSAVQPEVTLYKSVGLVLCFLG